jgi:hypothetical protein
MSEIHIGRAGATLGSFAIEEVKQGLQTGRFLPTDLGWMPGMAGWKPLSDIPELAAPAPATPTDTPPPPPIPPQAAAAAATPGVTVEPAWERRDTLGVFPALFQTIKQVLFEPARTFELMKLEGGIASPLLFILITQTVSILVGLLYQRMFPHLPQRDFTSSMGPLLTIQAGSHAFPLLEGIVAIPISVCVGSFIWSGIAHLCLMLVGAVNRPFETTYRVVCYAGGSASVLNLIPACGWVVALIWNIVLLVIGFEKTHRTTTGKAVAAVLLPLIVCCGGLAAVTALIGALYFRLQHHA